MSRRVSPEPALLMLHWQNSVCDPKGAWGKNLCRQIEKNNAVKNAQNVLAMARNRGMLTMFVNIGWRPGFPELPETSTTRCCRVRKTRTKASLARGRSRSSLRCDRPRMNRS